VFIGDVTLISSVTYSLPLFVGGWACSVNANTDLIAKRLSMEFCSFASSRKESIAGTAPNATGIIFNGQDPFRESQLDVDLYVKQGYEDSVVRNALDLIRSGLSSDNLVTDIKFPTAPNLYEVLDEEFFHFLNRTKVFDSQSEPERQAERLSLALQINSRWKQIIESYDARATTNRPIFEVHQRFRGVYVPDVDYNQIDGERIFGFILAGLIAFFAFGFAIWTFAQRKTTVVKASQPFFLIMVCIGALMFGSALFPLGIDDGIASKVTCSRACMSIPWLLALGWTILFSGLFAKLRRVNIVFRNAAQFRRLTVSRRDVLQPVRFFVYVCHFACTFSIAFNNLDRLNLQFLLLFTGNVSVLLTWTLMDPLEWERIEVSETSSYGTCTVQNDSSLWKVCFSLSIIFNFTALVLANVEAYRARNVKVEYGESRYIGMAMASTLQLFVVGMPLLFLVSDNPSVSYFVRCFLIFGVCMAFLMFLFIPKVLAWARTISGEEVNRSGPGLNVSMKKSFGGNAVRFVPLYITEVYTCVLKLLVVNTHRVFLVQFLSTNALCQQQAQIQLLSLIAKLDDLYELLRLDGVNGTEYFERAGLKCRKQFGELGLSDVPEESEDDGAFLDLPEVGADRHAYMLAVTTTTISSSIYDKPESLVSEPDVTNEMLKKAECNMPGLVDGESNADVACTLMPNSQEVAENLADHHDKR
jgi:7 transmembrane sweet-taste receptor of 3 GCPR